MIKRFVLPKKQYQDYMAKPKKEGFEVLKIQELGDSYIVVVDDPTEEDSDNNAVSGDY